MDDVISKASVCEILADLYPTDGEKVVAVEEIDKAYEAIQRLPSAEPEIVRCKNCRYWREHKYARETKRYIPFCGFNAIYTEADDFCSKGTRRKSNEH